MILLLLFSSLGFAVSMSVNQCANIQTGDVGSCNSTMDIKCTTAFKGSGPATNSMIAPVNQARISISFGTNALKILLCNETDIGNAYQHRWGTDSVMLQQACCGSGEFNKPLVVLVVTHDGKYARLANGGASEGTCTYATMNTTGPGGTTCTPIATTMISDNPYLNGTTMKTLPETTLSVQTNHTLALLYSTIDGGYLLSNTTNYLNFNPVTFPGSAKFSLFYDAYYNKVVVINGTWSTGSACPGDSCSSNAPIGSVNQLNYLTCGKQAGSNLNINFSPEIYPPAYVYYCWNNDNTYLYRSEALTVNTSLTNKMLALLHLEEDGSTCPLFFDSSYNDNGGICVGSAPTRVNGVFGYGMYHNFTAYHTIDLINLTDNPIDFSVSIWAKPSINPGYPDFKNAMITKSSSWLLWSNVDDSPLLWIWDQDFNLYAMTAPINITGAWHNLAFTVNSTTQTAKLYIDGILYSTEFMPTYSRTNPNNEAVLLGQMGGFEQIFDGVLDEVAYWNRTLTPSEILQVYQKKDIAFLNNQTGGGFSVNENIVGDANSVYHNFRFFGRLYNYSTFFIITGVTYTPINPQGGQNVTVAYQTSLPSNTKIFYRYRNVTSTDTEFSYSGWVSILSDQLVTYHFYDIPNVLDGKYYQFYVESDNVTEWRSGLYYNFTVGAYGSGGIVPGTSAVPTAVGRLEASGFCSGSTCVYIFGFFIVAFVAILSFFYGGVKNGATMTASAIVVLAVIGLLPWFMLIPIVLYVVVYIMKHLNIMGGGN